MNDQLHISTQRSPFGFSSIPCAISASNSNQTGAGSTRLPTIPTIRPTLSTNHINTTNYKDSSSGSSDVGGRSPMPQAVRRYLKETNLLGETKDFRATRLQLLQDAYLRDCSMIANHAPHLIRFTVPWAILEPIHSITTKFCPCLHDLAKRDLTVSLSNPSQTATTSAYLNTLLSLFNRSCDTCNEVPFITPKSEDNLASAVEAHNTPYSRRSRRLQNNQSMVPKTETNRKRVPKIKTIRTKLESSNVQECTCHLRITVQRNQLSKEKGTDRATLDEPGSHICVVDSNKDDLIIDNTPLKPISHPNADKYRMHPSLPLLLDANDDERTCLLKASGLSDPLYKHASSPANDPMQVLETLPMTYCPFCLGLRCFPLNTFMRNFLLHTSEGFDTYVYFPDEHAKILVSTAQIFLPVAIYGYFYEIYFLASMTLAIYFTSIFHWSRPRVGVMRLVDMTAVQVTLWTHILYIYISMSLMRSALFTIGCAFVCAFFPLSNFFTEYGFHQTGTLLHGMMHITGGAVIWSLYFAIALDNEGGRIEIVKEFT